MPLGESPVPTPKVCVAGPLVLALVMGPLEHAPRAGEEQISPTSSIAPGGSANQAIALARLGLDTELICSIGIDEAGALVRQMLTAHHVDLEHAARVPSQAITVALGFEGDRALTTSGDLKVPALSKLRAAPHALVAELGVLADNADTLSEWRQRGCVDRIGEGGELIDRTWVLSECRWDPTGQWKQSDLDPLKYVDVFSLNEHEAVSYTRKSDAKSAARQLLWQVPGVVVTRGANGVFAVIDDEEISLPAAPARTIDPTSAGHAFSAALVYARVKGLHPRAAISMAMLAAARSTESMGSFLAAPTLQELCEWTKTCDVPEGYDLAFLDLAQASAESASDQEDAGLSDEDPRDGSAFEVATDIA
ncbi:carbohydrate kinase family protein [Schaalia cardiffensis]|uniref:carbohydrate kinase family protein n=1 Tax=Schaalia cardiffensis TaxID=181487 RepID=UPI002AB19EA2|nr:carbohydrate kinase family protein [Schaalia cardiffensis]